MRREVGPGGAFRTLFWGRGSCMDQRWYHSKERLWLSIGSALWPLRYI